MLTAPVLTIVDGLCNEIGLMSTIKERPPFGIVATHLYALIRE